MDAPGSCHTRCRGESPKILASTVCHCLASNSQTFSATGSCCPRPRYPSCWLLRQIYIKYCVINPQNPDDIELLCIGVGYRESRDGNVETHVLFRRGTKPRHELELLDRLYEWFLTHRAGLLLTYNGKKFDLLHLRGRAERAERSLGGRNERSEEDRNDTRDSRTHRPVRRRAGDVRLLAQTREGL